MSYWRRRFFSWIDRRSRSAMEHRLNHKNLYIFPTGRGMALLLVALILWLFGTNYQNNLILALVFFLLSVFHIVKLLTYFNLSGLQLRWQSAAPVFVGEQARFIFVLKRARKSYADALVLQFQRAKHSAQDEQETVVDVAPGVDNVVSVQLKAGKRGWQKPNRLLVKSDFPLGLLRCWTWLNWDACVLVYPCPVELPLTSNSEADDDSQPAQQREFISAHGDDFSGVRDYREGDSLKRIAWKNYARDDQLVTKTFDDRQDQELWLDFHCVASVDLEQRLSGLCYWALEYHRAGHRFGLRMPGKRIPPDSGEAHLGAVLTALATYATSAREGELM